jgi:hypothetical protein
MSSWSEITSFLHTWYGIATAITASALTLYYGPRQMLETWEWYLNRYLDEPVMDILREQGFLSKSARARPVEEWSVGDLAKRLKRSQLSIGKSIGRLKRKNLIELYRGGFRLKE